MASVFAFGFVIGAVVDYLTLGITLHMVRRRVGNGRDPQAGGMPAMPAKEKVLRPFAVVTLKCGQGQGPRRH